jgi:hypothetical protein
MRKKPAACISAIDSSGTLRSAVARRARSRSTGIIARARSISSSALGIATSPFNTVAIYRLPVTLSRSDRRPDS